MKKAAYPIRLAYLVDEGSAHPEQLRAAHAVVAAIEKRSDGFRPTAGIGFDTDDRIPALQAADVIAWASRRRHLEGALPEEFVPLNEVLQERVAPTHGHLDLPMGGIKMLADPINRWIERKGSIPTLADIIQK